LSLVRITGIAFGWIDATIATTEPSARA
jgi:hypothetical protein